MFVIKKTKSNIFVVVVFEDAQNLVLFLLLKFKQTNKQKHTKKSFSDNSKSIPHLF